MLTIAKYIKQSLHGAVPRGLFVCPETEMNALPYKPKRPCGHPNCPNLSDGYYCEKHRKEHAKTYNRFDRDPGSAKRYSGTWRKTRARFLAANPLCELCRRDGGRYVPATVVHHKRKLTDGGTNEPSNLQSLCASCHSRIHAGQGDGLNKK